ncbi:MAG: ATP-binding cassette domain-containing protein, partial [Ruminococcus sp.]|nr:ATP-binding cassette domain-containing protein [Ruminococcus sp.]
MPEIELLHISKSFQTKEGSVQALKDVNLSIETGDIYGIIGMSGAGKSTLVRCMNYLEIPSEGVVKLQGEELAKLSDRQLRKKREKAGMIFQHFNLLMQKNVLSNICFPLLIQGTSKGDSEKRAMELLEMVGMTDKAKAFPSQLSGGQKQRVAIARALASEPKILLCDEATSALDPQTTSAILELLKKINRELGITIVVITHQMSVVRQICNKVAIMKEGRIVETGNTLDIFSHPKSEVARELLRTDVDVQAEKKVLWEVDNIKGG